MTTHGVITYERDPFIEQGYVVYVDGARVGRVVGHGRRWVATADGWRGEWRRSTRMDAAKFLAELASCPLAKFVDGLSSRGVS